MLAGLRHGLHAGCDAWRCCFSRVQRALRAVFGLHGMHARSAVLALGVYAYAWLLGLGDETPVAVRVRLCCSPGVFPFRWPSFIGLLTRKRQGECRVWVGLEG